MKTVIDAVNELNGEWPFGWGCMCQASKVNVSYPFGTIRESFHPDVNERHIHLCSKEEFLATVAECETNFGECNQSYSDYKFDYHLHPALKRNKPTLIFTQEMADNGVLPIINNEIMYQYGITNYAKGTIKGVDGNQYWIKADCGGYVECNISKLKPITPPITLIDGKAYQFDFIGCAFLGFYHDKSDEFTASKSGMNSVICRLDECTNIQPLTVEVK